MKITIQAMAILFVLGGTIRVDAQAPASVWAGVFTEQQAKRGEALQARMRDLSWRRFRGQWTDRSGAKAGANASTAFG